MARNPTQPDIQIGNRTVSIPNRKTAAASLPAGLELDHGWKVVEAVDRNEDATGGNFSHSYIVEKDSHRGFLKAFDFSDAFEPGKETIQLLKLMTSAYEHEREILWMCREKRLSNVVMAIESGSVQAPGIDGIDGRVFYLIFELADGDVRRQVAQEERFDTLWSIRALKDVCLGLFQVHREMVAHQDMKPSNVLAYGNGFRISDFGRSSRRGRSVWYDDRDVAGDATYSPPELIYGFTHPEFAVRRFGCDMYMLGNLASFMFAGVNMTAGIFSRIAPQFHPQEWQGKYQEVLPYVQEAFTRTLADIAGQIPSDVREDMVSLIRELCNPDVSVRGHPRGIGRHDQYSLERYVSRLAHLADQFEIRVRIRLRKAQ